MPAFLTGSLVLILLQVIVANPNGAAAAGGLFKAIGDGSQRLLNADRPALGPGRGPSVELNGASSGATVVPASTTPQAGAAKTSAKSGTTAGQRESVDSALRQLSNAGLFGY